nr:PREDICTED: putative gustatory receptor 28b isoform X1 [Tribolium castaneum]|eukprot:XP_015833292.1 PREDICTED: putative gustatory receptor 28b isoform X1 [Tribolium castaneum]
MQVAMTVKCLTLFLVIENIFDHLNSELNTGETTKQLVEKIRNFYHDTYDLTIRANKVIALQLIVPLCITFVMVVYHIYYQIKDSSLQTSVTVLVWLSTMLVKIVVVIVQIHRTTSAVFCFYFNEQSLFLQFQAKNIRKTLIKLTLNRTKSVRREINVFFLQLLHEEVKITGASFFNIDVGLIGGYFGKALQYLLILYQTCD